MQESYNKDGDAQFPVYPPELMTFQPSDQYEQEDVPGSLHSVGSSSTVSPTCWFDFLRLSSESDDCFEPLSPFSPSFRRFSATDETQSKTREVQGHRHETEVSFNTHSGRMNSEFVFEMESEGEENGEVMADKWCQEEEEIEEYHISSLNPPLDCCVPSNVQQPIGKATAKGQGNGKDAHSFGRDSTPKAEKQSDPNTSSTHQSPTTSHSVEIPATSHLALRRKLKRQASNPLPATIGDEKANTKGIPAPTPRLLSRPTLSPDQLRFPVPPKSPRISAVTTGRQITKSPRANRSSRNFARKDGRFKYPENTRVPRSPARKTRTPLSSREMGQTQGKSSLKNGKMAKSTWEKEEETFQERNRKKTIPSLPNICPQNRRSTCPASVQPTRKFAEKSSVCSPVKMSQVRPATSPRTTIAKHRYFVYAEKMRVSRTSTTKISLEPLWASYTQKHRSIGGDHQSGNSKSTDGQGEARKKNNAETSQETQSSIPSQPKICQPRQRRLSRHKAGTSGESCAVTSQDPRPPPKLHTAKQGPLPSLQMPGGKIAATVPNTTPSHLGIPSTSHLAIRRKLKRQSSSPLPEGTRGGSVDARESSTQPLRMPPITGTSLKRLSSPVPLKSSAISTAREKEGSVHGTKTPKMATIKGGHLVFL